ncbi:MAG: homocysteine S-methyltransferase family protein [Pseudomonadota bacterium]
MTESKSMYRDNLPQLGAKMFIADGGLETSLIFQQEVELPLFAAFPLTGTDEGISQLNTYYQPYIDIALANRTGIILDTPTWRASHGWGEQLGYSALDMQFFNESSINYLLQLRQKHQTTNSPMVINGVIGPRGDGYHPSEMMSSANAESYHAHQIEVFARTQADMVTAVTMPYVEEAVGIARAAAKAGIPAAISFTTETDGRLPTGMSLRDAIQITESETDGSPVYYMINCAHPTHFNHVIEGNETWMQRIYGIRANASCMSHAELDEALELDDGNPMELGEDYVDLARRLTNLKVVGGCCGTDHRHIDEICRALEIANPGSRKQVA